MLIRPFRDGDEHAASAVVKDAFLNHQYDFQGCPKDLIGHDISIFSPDYIKHQSTISLIFLVTSDDDRTVYAFASLKNDEIHMFYTIGSMQKKGVGKFLMSHIEKAAISRGIKSLWANSNFYAEAFYLSCGFRKTKDIIVHFYGKDWPVSFMVKELSPD